MHIFYFTERPHAYVPEDVLLEHRSWWGLPNRYCDPAKAGELYNRYLDEKIYAEEIGIEGVLVNEHHGTAICGGVSIAVDAAILARATKKVKIISLGSPVTCQGNILKLAEELALIDTVSGGRLVTGVVRGVGPEHFANNDNPAHNREMFVEAVDFIIKAWTVPGPFRHEGRHFHYRFVNPWALPLQKPHPPIWIPGFLSPETVTFAAQRRYPFIALATHLQPTVELWNIYADVAAQQGYQAGPENFGYMQRVIVADTDAKADELSKQYMYGGGFPNFARPEWAWPPGYNSKAATRRMARQMVDPTLGDTPFFYGETPPIDLEATRKRLYGPDHQAMKDSYQIIAGTPRTVLPKIRHVLELLRPGMFGIWHNEGRMGHADTMRSLELMGAEVLPAIKEMGRELGLDDAFERPPGTRPLPASGQRDPVVGSPG